MAELTASEFGFLTELERYDAFLRLYRSADPEDERRLEALYASPDPLVPLILLRYLEDIPEKPACAALIRLVESPIEIVSRTAMASYNRSHYPGKTRLLKQLILSPSARACRFATRTLARAGFMEILPLVLRELPDREPDVRAEMMLALRYLPDPRVPGVLAPLAASSEEPVRYLAVRVLAELQPRLGEPGAAFFVRRSRDESERVRRAALEALQRFPSRRVAPLILETALDPAAHDEDRVRAVRSMASFPAKSRVRPLTALAAGEGSAALRLGAEIALRAFPPALLRPGLHELLDDEDPALRRQAALFLADFLGHEPAVREKLLAVWRRADDARAFELVDALRALPGVEAELLLAAAVARGPLVAYGTASALAGRRGPAAGRLVLDLLSKPVLDPLLTQTLLDRFVRRGPDEGLESEVLALLRGFLRSDNLNVRYLATRAFEWYPPLMALSPLLALLALERDRDVARAAEARLAKGVGRDPRALLEAIRAHPGRERLATHAFRIVVGTGWDPAAAEGILESMAGPDGLLTGRPRLVAACLVHLFEHGSATLPRLWEAAEQRNRLPHFLRLLAAAVRGDRRVLPPLPLSFLETRLKEAPPHLRALHYDLLAADGRGHALKGLLALLVREIDGVARARGAAAVRTLLLEARR